MKTKLLLFLLCLASLNVLGLTDDPPKKNVQGTITRKKKQTTETVAPKPKPAPKPTPKPTPKPKPTQEAAGYDVTFKCNVSSASLYIDGNANGNAGGTRFLKTGSHRIKVTANGYEDYTTSIQVSKSNTSFSFQLTALDAKAIYSKGLEYDNKKDYVEAVKWYRKAAEQGQADAQTNLGYCYEKGYGVTQDYVEAVKWYRKAAEQGEAYAQNNLGECYYYGRGVTQDYVEAVKWYSKAVEQGNASAQYDLGYCYQYGNGVTKDENEAIKWYKKAARQGHETSQQNLKELGITEW